MNRHPLASTVEWTNRRAKPCGDVASASFVVVELPELRSSARAMANTAAKRTSIEKDGREEDDDNDEKGFAERDAIFSIEVSSFSSSTKVVKSKSSKRFVWIGMEDIHPALESRNPFLRSVATTHV